jgi:hypothetical protein
MKLPFDTTSTPLVDKEASRVIRAVNAGRAASNTRARAFAAKSVSQWKEQLPNATQSVHTRPSSPMPTISRFYGIAISLRPREQNHPRAHFHAEYGEFAASISIENFQVLDGFLPRRALEMTIMWAALHQAELRAGWDTLRMGRVPEKIEPLE